MLYEDFYNDVSPTLNIKRQIRSLLQLDLKIEEISSLVPCDPSAVVGVLNEYASTTNDLIEWERLEEWIRENKMDTTGKTNNQKKLIQTIKKTFTKKQIEEITNGKR